MNKKQLYESIMQSVAKEVKKVLLEDEQQYATYHDAELDAIHYDKIPNNLKEVVDGEEHVLAEKMSHEQLILFVTEINWNLLGEQYRKFYPKAYSFYEDYIYDTDISMDGGTLYVQVPCSDVTLEVDVEFDWHYIPYDPGDRLQPPEGGYGELNHYNITSIDIFVNDKKRTHIVGKDIALYNLDILFSDEIHSIADNMEQDDEYFHPQDDDAYDRWKDEQWERGID